MRCWKWENQNHSLPLWNALWKRADDNEISKSVARQVVRSAMELQELSIEMLDGVVREGLLETVTTEQSLQEVRGE